MEMDLSLLKENIAYVIIKTANGYLTIDPNRKDINVWANIDQLNEYLKTMET